MSFVVEFRPFIMTSIPEIITFLREPTVSPMDRLYALSKLLHCHSLSIRVTSLASAFLIYSIADIQHFIRPAVLDIISLLKDSEFDVRKKSSAVLFKLLNGSEYFTFFFCCCSSRTCQTTFLIALKITFLQSLNSFFLPRQIMMLCLSALISLHDMHSMVSYIQYS